MRNLDHQYLHPFLPSIEAAHNVLNLCYDVVTIALSEDKKNLCKQGQKVIFEKESGNWLMHCRKNNAYVCLTVTDQHTLDDLNNISAGSVITSVERNQFNKILIEENADIPHHSDALTILSDHLPVLLVASRAHFKIITWNVMQDSAGGCGFAPVGMTYDEDKHQTAIRHQRIADCISKFIIVHPDLDFIFLQEIFLHESLGLKILATLTKNGQSDHWIFATTSAINKGCGNATLYNQSKFQLTGNAFCNRTFKAEVLTFKKLKSEYPLNMRVKNVHIPLEMQHMRREKYFIESLKTIVDKTTVNVVVGDFNCHDVPVNPSEFTAITCVLPPFFNHLYFNRDRQGGHAIDGGYISSDEILPTRLASQTLNPSTGEIVSRELLAMHQQQLDQETTEELHFSRIIMAIDAGHENRKIDGQCLVMYEQNLREISEDPDLLVRPKRMSNNGEAGIAIVFSEISQALVLYLRTRFELSFFQDKTRSDLLINPDGSKTRVDIKFFVFTVLPENIEKATDDIYLGLFGLTQDYEKLKNKIISYTKKISNNEISTATAERKISQLCKIFYFALGSDVLKTERGILSMRLFSQTGNTESYQETIMAIKGAVLRILKQSSVGDIAASSVAVARTILGQHTGRGIHVFNPESLNSEHLKKHEAYFIHPPASPRAGRR